MERDERLEDARPEQPLRPQAVVPVILSDLSRTDQYRLGLAV